MISVLRRYVQVFRQYRTRKLVAPYVHPDAVLMPGFKLLIYGGQLESRFEVGAGAMLDCRLHFDRDIGGISIGENTWISQSDIICAHEIRIGSDVGISWGCTINDHDSHPLDWHKRTQFYHEYRRIYQKTNNPSLARATKDWSQISMAPIVIEDKVLIGHDCIIKKGVTIGEGAIIASGSIVTKSIPPWHVAAGCPARVVKRLERDV